MPLFHAYGAVFDNPDLIACCVVGDGEAETGPLATSWHSNKFFNPRTDGAVLPILHLNGYKIANPDRAGPDQPQRAGMPVRRLRLQADFCRRRRPGNHASVDGCCGRHSYWPRFLRSSASPRRVAKLSVRAGR
jgi:hypothetical protein